MQCYLITWLLIVYLVVVGGFGGLFCGCCFVWGVLVICFDEFGLCVVFGW